MVTQGKPFWLETPKRKTEKPSVFKLPLALELLKREGVDIDDIVQCELGALTQKPTDIMHFLRILKLLHASGPHRLHNSSPAPLACLRSCLALNRRAPNSLPQPVQRYRSESPALQPLSLQAMQVALRSICKAFLKAESQ